MNVAGYWLPDAYFIATRGEKVLWMNHAQTPGSGIFTGYLKDK